MTTGGAAQHEGGGAQLWVQAGGAGWQEPHCAIAAVADSANVMNAIAARAMSRPETAMVVLSCVSPTALQWRGQASRDARKKTALGRLSPLRDGRPDCVRNAGTNRIRNDLTMMGEETFHPDTRALLAYGRALAGAGAAPKRGRADHVLERLFVIERTPEGRWPLRTFGADLVKLFGRDLKEHDFATFWLEPDRRLLNALMDASGAANEPAIARVVGEAAVGRALAAEILLTPLRVEPAFGDRFLGMFQALGGEAFTEGRAILRLRLGSLHPPLAKAPRGMRLVVSND